MLSAVCGEGKDADSVDGVSYSCSISVSPLLMYWDSRCVLLSAVCGEWKDADSVDGFSYSCSISVCPLLM